MKLKMDEKPKKTIILNKIEIINSNLKNIKRALDFNDNGELFLKNLERTIMKKNNSYNSIIKKYNEIVEILDGDELEEFNRLFSNILNLLNIFFQELSKDYDNYIKNHSKFIFEKISEHKKRFDEIYIVFRQNFYK